MLLASIIMATLVTALLIALGVVWAVCERYIAAIEGWSIAFSLRERLVVSTVFALVASSPMWLFVVFVVDNPTDMPADYYLPIPFVGFVLLGAYAGIVVWRVLAAQKAKANAQTDGAQLVSTALRRRRSTHRSS